MRTEGIWGMLYADDVGIVSKSAEGLAKLRAVIATVFEATALTVPEKKIEKRPQGTPDRPDNSRRTARHRSSRPEVGVNRRPSSNT